MSWSQVCSVVICSWDQSFGFRKGFLCLVQFWIRLLSVRLLPPGCFPEDRHALEQNVSAVMDGTVELRAIALVWCTNLHCKCFLSSSSVMVFFMHVARLLLLELVTLCPSDSICTKLSACTTRLCKDSELSISHYNEPIDGNLSHCSAAADSSNVQ